MISPRRPWALVLVVAVGVACGGKTVGGVGSGSGSGTSTGSTGSSGSSTGSTSTTSSTTSSSTSECVDFQISSSDLSCGNDGDCTTVLTGEICSGRCGCGGTAANNAAATRFEEDTSSIQFADCPCASAGEPRCLGGQCTMCGFGPNQPAACQDGGVMPGEGGVIPPPNDGGFGDVGSGEAGSPACVDIDISTYSQSCASPSDCIAIFTGEVCVPSDCPCSQDFVNISEQARYDQAINSLPPDSCICPTLGAAKCISGTCAGG